MEIRQQDLKENMTISKLTFNIYIYDNSFFIETTKINK